MGIKLQNFMPIPFCGCHIWLGSVDKDGYGTIRRVGGAHLKAHREAYRYFIAEPSIKQVLHKCDVPACINPNHLYLGDPAANARDKVLRGRIRVVRCCGSKNGMAKLTQKDVDVIKYRYSIGELQKVIAKDYSLRQPTISKIVRGERW